MCYLCIGFVLFLMITVVSIVISGVVVIVVSVAIIGGICVIGDSVVVVVKNYCVSFVVVVC